MQLRAHTRRPGRYREDDIPPLPGTAKFTHPTTPYDPNLPLAAFPTLDVPRPLLLSPRPSPRLGAIDVNGSEMSAPVLEGGLPQRPAAVFRGTGKPPRRLWPVMIQHEREREEDDHEQEEGLSGSQHSTSSQDPGKFDPDTCCIDVEDQDKNQRVGLPVYEHTDDWKHITGGLKLVILSELMKFQSFKSATEALILSDNEIEEIYNLHEQEAIRQADEDARIAKAQARQLEALMQGALTTNKDRVCNLFADNIFADLETSAMFMFSRKQIQQAQRFLNNLKLSEYANRLWRYHGVAIVPKLICVHTNSPSSFFWSPGNLRGQQHLQALQAYSGLKVIRTKVPDIQSSDVEKNKQSSLDSKQPLSTSRGRETQSTASPIVKVKIPASGLRNVITAEEQEITMATVPTALQESSLLQGQKPVPPKLPEISTNFGTPKVMFKSLSHKLSPSTSPPPETLTFDLLALAGQTKKTYQSCVSDEEQKRNNEVLDYNEPCHRVLAAANGTPAADTPPSKLTEPFKVFEASLSCTEPSSILSMPLEAPISPNLHLSCAESQSTHLTYFEPRIFPSDFSLLSPNATIPPKASADTLTALSTTVQPQMYFAGERSTHFEPQMSRQISDSRISHEETPSTPSMFSKHQNLCLTSSSPSWKSRNLSEAPIEAVIPLSESPRLGESPLETNLKLFKSSVIENFPTDLLSTSLITQLPHLSSAEAQLTPSRPPKSPRTPQQHLTCIEPPPTLLKSKEHNEPSSEAQLTPSKRRNSGKSPVGVHFIASESPKFHQSPAEKRFAMVSKHLGITKHLSTAASVAIELGIPPRMPHIITPAKVSAKRIFSAEKAKDSVKAPIQARIESPASPDPLTGEVQTREPAKRYEQILHINTSGNVAFTNVDTTSTKHTTTTKGSDHTGLTQNRGKLYSKATLKEINSTAKEEGIIRNTILKVNENGATAVVPIGTTKTLEKVDKTKGIAAAKFRHMEKNAPASRRRNVVDKELPQKNNSTYLKRKRLHDSDDDLDL